MHVLKIALESVSSASGRILHIVPVSISAGASYTAAVGNPVARLAGGRTRASHLMLLSTLALVLSLGAALVLPDAGHAKGAVANAPAGFTAVAGDPQVTLSWDDATDPSPTSYQYQPKGSAWEVNWPKAGCRRLARVAVVMSYTGHGY